MKFEIITRKKGGKHTIKQIAELIESLGYNVTLKFDYGSIVESDLKGEIEYV